MFIPRHYTVESVTSGHPDKVCDQISDAILDACLMEDPMTRAGIEAFGSHGMLMIGGEVTTRANVDYEAIGRKVYQDIGYADALNVITSVAEQSPDIAMGVDTGGAGDQGIMCGFATDETPEALPAATVLVHKLTKGLEDLRRSGRVSWLQPDGKAQVTVADGKVKTVLVSCQHTDGILQEEIYETIKRELIAPLISDQVEILVNPTGKFVLGGFAADAGLTGRKLMVDTYGGILPHGGGAFSGKDPSKVDRSAAYMTRFVAKSIVRSGAAKQCLVSVAYAIGRADPLMVAAVDEKGEDLSNLAKQFDFRPRAIIERLDLRRPIYLPTAAYGHFGRNGFPWEEI